MIRSGSQIVDSVVGERCQVWASVLESSVVGDDCRIGPFAHLRSGAQVASGVELGNFAEVAPRRPIAGNANTASANPDSWIHWPKRVSPGADVWADSNSTKTSGTMTQADNATRTLSWARSLSTSLS